MSKIRYILLVAMLAIVASACQRRPLVEEDLSIYLKLELDYNIPNYAGAKSAQHMRASFYDLHTEGTGYYATGGEIVPIRWSRGTYVYDPFVFTLEDGTPITLEVGHTFAAVVSPSGSITFG